MFTIFRGYKNTLCQHSNDIENHLLFYVNKVYLVYLLRIDQKYTFWTKMTINFRIYMSFGNEYSSQV